MSKTREKEKSKRGFAAMDKERQREIASLGGIAAHASGRAHKFTSKTGRAAGIKGSSVTKKERS